MTSTVTAAERAAAETAVPHRHPRSWPSPRLGLRETVTLSFAAGALALSAIMAIGTYLVARDYLVDQREQSAIGQAFADAAFVRDGLRTTGEQVSEALGTVSPPADSTVFVRRDGEWYSSTLTANSDSVPAQVRAQVEAGGAGLAWVRVDGGAAVVVGTALPAVDSEFYELSRTVELDRTLDTLLVTLTVFAVLTTLGGALLGRWSARRVLAPLDVVAGATARIAGGDLRTRLPSTDDPELVTIVGSFNAMVDALAERVERDARFTADVSHELRSPLTTLTTSVQVMQQRRDQMPPTAQRALDLVTHELSRFRSALEDLLELGRLDSAAGEQVRTRVDLRELVTEALLASDRDHEVLDIAPGDKKFVVLVDKRQINRALVNLFENADLHGGGLARVSLRRDGSVVEVVVDDAGSGVSAADHERIFERFVRGGSRGSRPGTGLGLSLVAETLRAHGGSVRYVDRPGGGARFVARLPLAGPERRR